MQGTDIHTGKTRTHKIKLNRKKILVVINEITKYLRPHIKEGSIFWLWVKLKLFFKGIMVSNT